MTFYGADVSQLRALAKAADRAAASLSTQANSLHSQIQSAPWKGSDGDRFRQEWSGSHRPGLDKVVNSLREKFDLPGVPIRLLLRGTKNPYAEE